MPTAKFLYKRWKQVFWENNLFRCASEKGKITILLMFKKEKRMWNLNLTKGKSNSLNFLTPNFSNPKFFYFSTFCLIFSQTVVGRNVRQTSPPAHETNRGRRRRLYALRRGHARARCVGDGRAAAHERRELLSASDDQIRNLTSRGGESY